MGLVAKAQLAVQIERVVGLEINVLPAKRLDEKPDHLARNSPAAKRGLRPDINEIRITYPIR